MPAFPSLTPAIAFLQAAGGVTVQLWIPTAGPVLGKGSWAAATAIAKPYTIDTPTGSKALIQLTSGEVVTADLVIYCASSAAPAEAPAGSRQPRLFCNGKRFRVLGRRSNDGLPAGPATLGIVCAQDNGGET